MVGLLIFNDIMKELEKLGFDLCGIVKIFEFVNIYIINDLEIGMVVLGIVNNIINFGVFVDIGIKESGLVYIS